MTSLEQRTIIIPGVEKIMMPSATKDAKGPVYQWTTDLDGHIRQINSFHRSEGTLFGDHYHTGKDPSKNPELFIVLHGTIDFWAYDKFNDARGQTILTTGNRIIIHPHILHGFKALTDVVFIEPRLTHYGEIPDQFNADAYASYQKAL